MKIIVGLALAAVICASGCETNQTSTKDLNPKLQAMAVSTHSDEMTLTRMHLNRTPAPTVTTKDLTGAQLTLVVPPDQTGVTYTISGKLGSGTLTQTTPVPPTPPSVPGIPTSAISSGNLDSNVAVNGSKVWPWKWNHDAGTPGAVQNQVFTYPVAGQNGSTTAFEAKSGQTGKAGAIWHLTFAANDETSTHFVYDAWVMIKDTTQVANVEMDMNQVTADGKTYILATQCSHYDKKWDYTLMNAGTHWHGSNIPCDPTTWGNNTWHHIQIATHRDDSGNVFYDWINFDNVQSNFLNASGGSAENLGWGKVLLLNFQLDGLPSSGTMDAVVDNLQIWKW